MTCEVCNSEQKKNTKGGKEAIVMNPPLKEASDLPKKVITKGHEIAKSLIKHRSKVREPYAVGMATAKKSAGIKEDAEQVDELSKGTLGSYVNKAAGSAATHTGAAAAYGSSSKSPNAAKMAQHQAIATKRTAGIQKAVGKLTKEDVEHGAC
jgi:hypothetical protein